MDDSQLLRAVSERYCIGEQEAIDTLLPVIDVADAQIAAIEMQTRRLIDLLSEQAPASTLQQLLNAFSLSSEEGRALMALAESLLRIPDSAVADAVIADQLQRGDWHGHVQPDNPLFVRVSVLLLELSGSLLVSSGDSALSRHFSTVIKSLSAPVIQQVLIKMIRLLAGQFVYADDIDTALKQAHAHPEPRQLYSFDMLGEAAVCDAQSRDFQAAYLKAISKAGRSGVEDVNISIKLSALSPRFEHLQWRRVMPEIVSALDSLLEEAAAAGVGITIDAEEASRLELSLAIVAEMFSRWGGQFRGRLGLAVQAYSTRSLAILSYLDEIAQSVGEPLAVRLVKGAYWDTEIKQAQVLGLDAYPVFTEKLHTDLSYLACAHYLLRRGERFYPQFATHNPASISHILAIAGDNKRYEFQRLHGMGDELYRALFAEHADVRCRVYCPVGDYRELLPYLVRRILENGANNSFVRQLGGGDVDVAGLSRHPLTVYRQQSYREFNLPLPENLYGDERKNSPTINLASLCERDALSQQLLVFRGRDWSLAPVVAFDKTVGESVAIHNPATGARIGDCSFVNAETAVKALQYAYKVFGYWQSIDAENRAEKLQQFAELLFANRFELISLLISEAGKTVTDALDELREAIDFCHYYALQCRQQFVQPQTLRGPEGEANTLQWQGRGVFLCISPWNFPLAIFVGQVSAALAAGNTVLAKPAEQTPLIACRAVQLMHEAGFGDAVVQCLPGDGPTVARALLRDSRLAGVAFTGSTATARLINRQLAEREGEIIPLIAETGGQNAMIVDSSALPEQVVRDVMHSAFYSAGQRCSALRVLFLQEEICEPVIELLKGAMATLRIGDPANFDIDVGPVIDAEAVERLRSHIDVMRAQNKVEYAVGLPPGLSPQRFVAPHLLRIDAINELEEEYFGPLLHVISFRYRELDRMVDQINGCGYGLTAGIQSRDQALCQRLAASLAVGNVYINRGMTGAVVGVQPFGGRGLSGTGPKAGGPHYLQRFATEKSVSNNIAAIGGNVGLFVY